MTLPTLVQKYQEQVTVTKVKKIYNVLSNAVATSISENGPVDSWDVDYSDHENPQSSEMFSKYLTPYLKIMTDCQVNKDKGCKYTGILYRRLNNSSLNLSYDASYYYRYILSDGSVIWFRTNNNCGDNGEDSNVCAVFWHDVNGTSEPNQLGRDTFAFYVKHDRIVTSSNNDCALDNLGWGCSKFILQNGHMNYPATLYK